VSTANGATSEEQVDLSVRLGSLPSNVSASSGSSEVVPSKASLPKVAVEASTLAKKADWDNTSDFQKIIIRHDDDIPGMDSFVSVVRQTLSKMGGQMELSKIQIVMMNEIMNGKLKAGHLYDLPMICAGDGCIMQATCPFTEVQAAYPVSKPCPVEKAQVARWVEDYLTQIGEDEINAADMSLVRELVSIHIAQSRIAACLSTNPNPMIKVSIGFDKDGNKVEQERENPLNKERIALAKSMERLMRNLHMTREQHKKGNENLDTISAIYDKLTKKANDIAERFGLDEKDDIHGEKKSDIIDAEVESGKKGTFLTKINSVKRNDRKREEEASAKEKEKLAENSAPVKKKERNFNPKGKGVEDNGEEVKI